MEFRDAVFLAFASRFLKWQSSTSTGNHQPAILLEWKVEIELPFTEEYNER
jgi:hypothetical protein